MNVSRLIIILSLKCTAVVEAAPALRGMTPCDLRRWHIDIESATPGCSNSWKVPSSWRLPGNEARMFYDSSDKCCSDLFDTGKCNIADFCECREEEENDTCVVTKQSNLFDPLRDHCESNAKWHFDIDTKRGCTNSPRFPDGWKDPSVELDYFFDTPEGCCEKFTKRGAPCPHIDVCIPYKEQKKGERTLNEIKVDIQEFLVSAGNTTGEKIQMHYM